MSRYGVDFYGNPTIYGELPLIEFDARPVTAICNEYGQIHLSWRAPSGEWDILRVTRDTAGFAPRYDMGTLVLEALSGTFNGQNYEAPTEIFDPDLNVPGVTPLIEGRFYYYTIWVHDVTVPALPQWKRAGDVIALVVKDWGYRSKMYGLIPLVYRDKDSTTPTVDGRGQLERFIDIPGFQADHIRTELETLKWVNDASRVSGGLLPLMARQLGMGYEAELGMRLARQQVQNAVHIWKHKGSALGVEAVISSFTGWAPTIVPGRNLVLDQNDAAAGQTSGRWTNVSNTTVGRRLLNNGVGDDISGGGLPQPPAGASTGDVGAGSYALLFTAIGAGDMVVQSFPTGTSYDNRTLSIPVTGNQQYTISIYSRALDTARSVRIGAEWFNIGGTSLGAVTENTAVSNATGSWTRHTYTVTAPATAAWLRIQLRVMSAATGNRVAFAAFQVETGAAATAYQSARSVRIQFTAERINLVTNPSAEVNTTGWPGTTWATLARDTTQYRDGSASFRLTVDAGITAGSNARMLTGSGTSGIPVLPNRDYTASGYALKLTAPVRQVRFDIQWYTAAGAAISNSTGTAVTEVAGVWTRFRISARSPANAAFATLMPTVITPAGSEVHYFDSYLFETGLKLLDFFDGQSYSAEGEYIWESGGTPGNARSYYYSRRLIKNYRLNQRLPEFLPAGSTWALLYAGAT